MTTTRPCRIGDTIETAQPMNFGSYAGRPLAAKILTPEACAHANDLINLGRWRVLQCGRCGKLVERCGCEDRGEQ